MQNIRLDYIASMKEGTPELMASLRKKFMDLDIAILELQDHDNFGSDKIEIIRTIALARTHLETSLMFAIKSLALLGED